MADIPGSAATRAILPRGADFTAGDLERDGDSDWYRVQLQRGVNYAFNADIEIEPPFPDDGYVSLRFRLRDGSGNVIDEDVAETYDGYDAGFEYRPDASGTYFLEVVGDRADYGLRAFADAAPDVRTMAEIEVGQTRDLSFFYGGDVDTYGIDLVGGRTYDFAASFDTVRLTLLDSDGDVLAIGRFNPIEDFEAPSTGRYFLRAESEYGEERSEYRLSARESGEEPPGPRVVRLTEGDDEFAEQDRPRDVFGLGGDDDIFAYGDGSRVFGGGGDDTLGAGTGGRAEGGPGGDTISDVRDGTAEGGPGDDSLSLGLSGSSVSGGSGRDTFVAMASGGDLSRPDTIADFARGQDVISLGSFVGGEGRSAPFTFVGRAGLTGPRQVGYRFEGDTTVVEASYEDGGTAAFRYEIPGRLALTAADFLLGARTGPGNDRFAGTPYADDVTGYGGDDRLFGTGGPDSLFGFFGDDLLDGGAGRDRLGGFDGADTVRGGAGDDLVDGGEGDDLLFGGEGDDEATGDRGDDAVSGGGGDDALDGGEGADRLDGGAGADRLEGTDGGGDLLRGGSGGDTFAFGPGYAFVGALGAGAAVIEDFVRGTDTIDVGEVDASRGGAGDQDFAFIGTRAFSGASQLRIAREGGDTVVQGSTDLDRAPEFEIVVRGNLPLAADDFVL